MRKTNRLSMLGMKGEMKAGRKKTIERAAYIRLVLNLRGDEKLFSTYNDFLVDYMPATRAPVDKVGSNSQYDNRAHPLDSTDDEQCRPSKSLTRYHVDGI